MSDMSEREALSRFVEAIKQADGAARVIGHYRRDQRWIFVATKLREMLEKASVMAVQRLPS